MSARTYNPFEVKAPTLKLILVGAGPIEDLSLLQRMVVSQGYQIAAVDGGYDAVNKAGLRPVFSLGDFDSTQFELEEISYGSEDVVELSPDKDKTDFEEALEEAFYRGFTEVVAFGILGGKRADFSLNNLLVLSKYASPERKVEARSPEGKEVLRLLGEGGVFSIDEEKGIDLKKPISVIPVSEGEIQIAGMAYDYAGKIAFDSSLTMSNRGRAGGKISLRSGRAYVSFFLEG